MGKKRTHEEYVAEVAMKNPNIEVVEEYIDAHTKILHRCKIDDVAWKISPDKVLMGQGCEKCKSRKISQRFARSHDDYVQNVAKINPNIEVLEKYINSSTRIKHRCKIDNTVWTPFPANILRGEGCPTCGKKSMADALRKSHIDYVREVEQINPNIEVVGEYVDAKTNVLHRCKIDGYEWSPTPDSVLSGRGCPQCRNLAMHQKFIKPHSIYVQELFEINPNIEVLEAYVDSDTKILHKCLLDDYIWPARPSSLLGGVGCPRCANKERYTSEAFSVRLHSVHPNIDLVGLLTSVKKPTLFRCTIDGYEWSAIPNDVLKSLGCPKCNGRVSMSHQEYVDLVRSIHPNVDVVEEFQYKSIPILHRCAIHDYTWATRPYHVLNGHGCPLCCSSVGERFVRNYLIQHNIGFEPQYKFEHCRNKKQLPFDFYLPELNVCIEYDGIQHFRPVEFFGGQTAFEECRKNDAIKNKFCETSQIILLRIRYDQDIFQVLDEFFKTIQNN